MAKIDETILVDTELPKSWTCPHCGKRNKMGRYKEEELFEFFKTMQHCYHCGYVHIWLLELTEDFKRRVVNMLMEGGQSMTNCGNCKYSVPDWTNPNNPDCYCKNEISDHYGYNTADLYGCEDGEEKE